MAGLDEDFGFDRKQLSEITDDMLNRAEQLFDDDINIRDETSPILNIIRSVALEIARLWDVAEDVYYSAFLETASGQDLDKIAMLVGLVRDAAEYSTGTVTFTLGDSAGTISEGFRVGTTDYEFVVTEDTTFEVIDDTVDAPVRATEPGPEYNVAANTIDEIIDYPPTGVLSVTNSSATSGGEDIESDADFRVRIRNAIIKEGLATKTSLESACEEVSGVKDVTVEKISDGEIKIWVCVEDGYTEADVLNDVEEVVAETKAFGITSTTVAITKVNINVQADVEITDSSMITVDDAEDDIIENINDYIGDLSAGGDVIFSKIYDLIYNAGDYVYDVTSLQIQEEGGSWVTANIGIADSEKAYPNTITINISEV